MVCVQRPVDVVSGGRRRVAQCWSGSCTELNSVPASTFVVKKWVAERPFGRDGKSFLRHMFESVGIRSRERLAEWIHSEGFPNQDGVHILVVEFRRGFGTRRSEPEPQESRPSSVTPWESLDHISVNDVFNRRFGVLQSCPAHLRGRWRQSVRVALEARHHGSSTGDGTQTDARPTATVHMATMLSRLHQMPGARAILPFVRLSYAQPSTYAWYDDEGERRIVTQAEGGEQGDPLMPLLFAIGIQGVLEEVGF